MSRSRYPGTTVFIMSLMVLALQAPADAQDYSRETSLVKDSRSEMNNVHARDRKIYSDSMGPVSRIPYREQLLSRSLGAVWRESIHGAGPEVSPSSLNAAQSWVRNYPSSTIGATAYQANRVAVDASGNVYVAGYGGTGNAFDFVTIKYSSVGDTAWTRTYNFLGGALSDDKAVALVVDTSGNVYVTGFSLYSIPPAPVRYEYATVKYNSSGVQQWVRRYRGVGGDNQPTALALDASGNVYVTGYGADTTDITGDDYATIKYNSNGDSLWAVRYHNGVAGGDDAATAIAVGGSGNVYVTGSCQYSGSGYEYVTIKYGGTLGDTLWARHYKGASSDDATPFDIAVDASDNIYLTGSSITALPFDYDMATVKYDSAGTQLWAARYDGPPHDGSADEGISLAVDASGNVYVAGRSVNTLTSFDYATIKYNSSGVQQWASRYASPGSGSDAPSKMVLDASANVYVTGTSNSHFATLQYSSTGVQQWIQTYVGPGTSDQATSLAINSVGDVYVTGGSSASGSGSIFTTVKYVQATVSAAPKVYLEGPYNQSTNVMNTTLRSSVLPAHFTSVFIPASAVDSIAIEIRDSTSAAGSTIRRFAQAWLLADGTVRNFTDTTKAFVEFDTPATKYYIVIWHRNHLAVMSSAKIDLVSSPPASWDFSTALSQAYLNGQKQIDTSPVRYGMVTGNVDGNTGIGASDIVQIRGTVGSAGYTINDVDLNGGVGASDIVLTRGNVGQVTQVP